MNNHYLYSLFHPSSIAVIGGNDETDPISKRVYRNIIDSGYRGEVFAVNVFNDAADGHPHYQSVNEIDKAVDLALISTLPAHIPDAMEAVAKTGCKRVVILSDHPRETTEEEQQVEHRACIIAREYGIRFVGPNALGLVNPHIGLNATYSINQVRRGNLALVSESGALTSAVLDWAHRNAVGFSEVISPGMQADISLDEILDYLITDRQTRSILLYLEGVRNSRRFISALRAASRAKPVIVLKSGRFQHESYDAISHAGAIIDNDDVFDSALSRSGVVRINNLSDMFAAARTLSAGMTTKGDRLAIVTNGVGPGLLAADRLVRHELPLACLAEDTIDEMYKQFPGLHCNPINLPPDAGAEDYGIAVSHCLKDETVDSVLVIFTPHSLVNTDDVANKVLECAKESKKPLFTCWMGEHSVLSSRQIFLNHGIATFPIPEAAIEGFYYLSQHRRNQKLLLQVPEPMSPKHAPDVESAMEIIDQALAAGRSVLNEFESKRILQAYHIKTSMPHYASNLEMAREAADSIGYPVVIKIHSNDITHKSDVGGVSLNIVNRETLDQAYTDMMERVARTAPEIKIAGVLIEAMHLPPGGRELAVGVIHDEVFGPAISFGSGGNMIEVFQDLAIALPPLNHYLVQNLIRNTRAHFMLSDYRGMPPANLDELEDILLRVSEMVCTLPTLKEMDLNPLIVDHDGSLMVVDARIVVAKDTNLGRYDHMAIHPYPSEYAHSWTAKNGIPVTVRPIRPEDAANERQFLEELSSESRYFRFMYAVPNISTEMVARFTQIDYDREIALVAMVEEGDDERQIGVARYATEPDNETCEFAIVVADHWQGQGIASRMMRDLINIARHNGMKTMFGDVLRHNRDMLALMRHLGFTIQNDKGDPQNVIVVLRLEDAGNNYEREIA